MDFLLVFGSEPEGKCTWCLVTLSEPKSRQNVSYCLALQSHSQ